MSKTFEIDQRFDDTSTECPASTANFKPLSPVSCAVPLPFVEIVQLVLFGGEPSAPEKSSLYLQ
jgi:hypothetical protein